LPLSGVEEIEAGFLLRRLQQGESLGLPHSRPMPSIGVRCHELRLVDREVAWRIIYHVDADAIVILEVFAKQARGTPHEVIETCRRRLRAYDSCAEGSE
jgi:phage-related protein